MRVLFLVLGLFFAKAKAKEKEPVVTLSDVKVSGEVKQAAAAKKLEGRMVAVRKCFVKAGGGVVKVELAVAPDGKVAASASGGDLGAPLDCVRREMEGLSFGSHADGAMITATITAPTVAGPAPTSIPTGEMPNEKPAPPKASARDLAPKVKGDIDRTLVKRIVRKIRPKLQTCYEEALKGRDELEGKLTVTFVIGVKGNVESADVTDSTLGDRGLARCVVNAVLELKFPNSPAPATVIYPFVFVLGR